MANRTRKKFSYPNNFPYDPSVGNVTTGGAVHEGRCEVPLGHPTRPLSPEQMRRKFADCAANALRPLRQEQADAIVDTVLRLEELSDVSELTRLLA